MGDVMRYIVGMIFIVAAAFPAQGQSLRLLLEEADLVVAGELSAGETGERFESFSMPAAVLLKGAAEPGFRVLRFTDLCCQAQHCHGDRKVLFLKRLPVEIGGIRLEKPTYTVFSGELGHITYEVEQETFLLDAVGDLLAAAGEDRALVTARVFNEALEEEFEPLVYALAHDVVATPGALALLDSEAVLGKFDALDRGSRSRARLLLLLGELAPEGLASRVEALARSPEGKTLLDPCAAILGRLGDLDTPRRLAEGFEGDPQVLYVLGRLGHGKGLEALESLMEEHLDRLHPAFIDALLADRTEAAVRLLGRAAEHKNLDAALSALNALARINTRAARDELKRISALDEIHRTVGIRAAVLLNGLSR